MSLFIIIAIALVVLLCSVFFFMNKLKKESRVRQEIMLQNARDQERRLLVQELHNDLGATIAGIINFLRLKSIDAEDTGESFEFLKMSEVLQQTYNSLRLRSHELYSTVPLLTYWESLVETVKAYCPQININSEIKNNAGDIRRRAGDEVKTALLFALKESVANIIKHAGADEVNLLLVIDCNKLHLTIKEEGKIAFKNSLKGDGIGLKLIREKVEENNGYFEYLKFPEGAGIKISLPY